MIRQEVIFMATLLIVEDDSKINEALCEYMKSARHKAIPAYDGADDEKGGNDQNSDGISSVEVDVSK